MTRPARIASLLLCLVGTTLVASPSSQAKKAASTGCSKALPKTCDEAVRYLLRTTPSKDLATLKVVPRIDLISYHMGWGMYIRNSLGLWQPHSALRASCAQKVGDSTLHPDGASSLLIEGVWDELHKGLEIVDFDTVAPDRYFEEVRRTIDRAKTSREPSYLATLPEWLYRARMLWFRENDTGRARLLQNQTDRLAEGDGELSLLALRYGTFVDPSSRQRESRLQTLLEVQDQFVDWPSYDSPETKNRSSFLPPWNDAEWNGVSMGPYHLRRISVGDFAASCLGSTYGKQFRNVKEYRQWMKQREANEFVHWRWMDTVTVDSLRKLSSNRRRFLEAVVLSNRFFHYTPTGELVELRSASGSATEAFVDFMCIADTGVSRRRFHDPDSSGRMFPMEETTKASRLGLVALSDLAHSLDRGDLLDMLDVASITHYDSAYRTDDLLEYPILGAFLLVSESERIVRDPDPARVFDLCLGYWNLKRKISWYQKDRIASMLFRIDPARARTIFASEFTGVPENGSFARNAILAAMIRHDFEVSRPLIERWFWVVQGRELNHRPSEAEVILDVLQSTDDDTRSLRRKLVRDRRFVPQQDE